MTAMSEKNTHTATHSLAETGASRYLLDQLLKDLLDEITTHLDPVSFDYLQSTSRYFRTVISIDRATLSKCMEWQIMLRFRKDMVTRPPVMACSLCKTRPKTRLYNASQLLVLIDKPNSRMSQEDPSMEQYYNFTEDERLSPSGWWSVNGGKALYYKAPSRVSQLKQRFAWLWKARAKDLNLMHLIKLYPESKPKCYVHFMEGLGTNDLIESLMPFIRISSQPRWLLLRMLRCMHCGRRVAEGDERTE